MRCTARVAMPSSRSCSLSFLGEQTSISGSNLKLPAVLLFVGPAEGEIDVGGVDKDIFGHIFGLEVLSMSPALADT